MECDPWTMGNRAFRSESADALMMSASGSFYDPVHQKVRRILHRLSRESRFRVISGAFESLPGSLAIQLHGESFATLASAALPVPSTAQFESRNHTWIW